jgi:hypothetical protein
MSSTLLGPLLPSYVAMPVQVMCAARGDCSPFYRGCQASDGSEAESFGIFG